MTNRRDFMRLGGVLAGLTLAPGLLDQAAAQEPGRGGRLVVPLVPEPPMIALQTPHPTHVIALNISDGLISYNDDYQPVPHLAVSGEVSDDGLTVRLNIREGVKWHDGQPLTSEDVRFSIPAIAGGRGPSSRLRRALARPSASPIAAPWTQG